MAFEVFRNSTPGLLRSQLFRLWTAVAVLVAYAYSWIHAPEILTWWKRTTTSLIEAGCDRLPYPWGDRIEATIGNFGLWVQITLAIVMFRFVIWLLMSATRRIRDARARNSAETQSVAPEDRL